MTLIKDGRVTADPWLHLDDETPPSAAPCTVSLARWQRERENWRAAGGPVGVRLRPDAAPEELASDLTALDLIVLEIDAFADGRVFTQARLLRDRLGFPGELRARGEFLRDQMFYLQRVGVNAFELAEGLDAEGCLAALREFSLAYQAAADRRPPVARLRRAAPSPAPETSQP